MDLEKDLKPVTEDLTEISGLSEESDYLTDPEKISDCFSDLDDSPRVRSLQKLRERWLDASGEASSSLGSAIDAINSAIEESQGKWQEIIDYYAEE
jgi:hypothetical protein